MTAKDGKGSVGSLEATFVKANGGVEIREDVVVVVFINTVEDMGLCTSAGSRVGAKEAGVVGDDSGGWGKNSTGGMRLASPVARPTLLTRDGGDGNLEAVLGTVLRASLGGVPSIWMRDAKERLNWLVDVFHPKPSSVELLKALPANC